MSSGITRFISSTAVVHFELEYHTDTVISSNLWYAICVSCLIIIFILIHVNWIAYDCILLFAPSTIILIAVHTIVLIKFMLSRSHTAAIYINSKRFKMILNRSRFKPILRHYAFWRDITEMHDCFHSRKKEIKNHLFLFFSHSRYVLF
jgi:hypothetical protein